MKNVILDKYYRFQPGEFLPIYDGERMLNKREFHAYRLKWIMAHKRAAAYQFTHYNN